jgi:transaldolase
VSFIEMNQIRAESGNRRGLQWSPNHMHWSEFVGGDVVISPPHKWQVRFNSSDVKVTPRIDQPVDPKIVDELLWKFADFERAYTEDGLSIDEFDSFAPTRRTLRQFIAACHDCTSIVRDQMLPDPDRK